MNAALPTTYKRSAQRNRDQLILDNVDYVARILSTMTFMISDDETRDNLHSAGVVGLVEAVRYHGAVSSSDFFYFGYGANMHPSVMSRRRGLPSGLARQISQHFGPLTQC